VYYVKLKINLLAHLNPNGRTVSGHTEDEHPDAAGKQSMPLRLWIWNVMRNSDLSFRLWKSETALETAGGSPFPSPALPGSGSMGQRSLLSL